MGITETHNETHHYHKGVGMTPEEIKMLKQLLEVRDQILSIVNKNEFGEAIDKGAKLVVRQLLERYEITEGEVNAE